MFLSIQRTLQRKEGAKIMPIWVIICYIIVSLLCIFAIAKLFGKETKEYAKSALSTYIVYTLIFLAVWIFKITVPSYTLLLTMATILLACFFGHYLGGYTRSKTFDRYLHAFGAFSFSLLTYCILRHFIETGSSKIFQALFIFTIGNTLGVIFELIEASHDAKNPIKSQKGLKDTDMDMLFNLIGSFLAGIFAYFWLL